MMLNGWVFENRATRVSYDIDLLVAKCRAANPDAKIFVVERDTDGNAAIKEQIQDPDAASEIDSDLQAISAIQSAA